MAAVIMAALVSLSASANWVFSAGEVVRLATLAVIFAVLNRYVNDERHLKYLLTAIMGSAVIPLAMVGYQAVTRNGLVCDGDFARVTGTFLHPNPLGIYLAMIILLGVSLYPCRT
ncbi:MAG: hypothetical protein ACXW1Y_13420 [Acidimicrobiia bacterium]